MRYSVKENTQLQRTQNSDYVIKPSQTVNLFFQAGNHYKRRNENSPSHKEKQCILWTIGFAVLLVKIRYIILYLGAAERRSESEKII